MRLFRRSPRVASDPVALPSEGAPTTELANEAAPSLSAAAAAAIDLAFAEHCQARIVRQGRVIIGAVFALNLLFWPLDWVVFAPTLPHHIPALIRCRTAITIITAGFLLFSLTRGARRFAFHAFCAAALGCCFIAAAAAASVGGPDVPNFHTLYVGVFASMPLPIVARRRALLTAALAFAIGLGLFVFTPQHLHSKYAPLSVSFLVCTFFISTWFGLSQFALLRDNFRQAAQLTAHGRQLESRVAERTEELRTLLDRVETARELERTRIARELHDELGQELSALRYALGLVKMRYEKHPLDVGANLDDLDDLLRRTARSTRSLVTDLRPRVIDDLGLGPAVEWLVKRTEERSGLTCHLSLQDEIVELDDRIAIAAFRVLQEALTNVVRHAQASEVEVTVAVREDRLCLSIADDGIGISAPSAAPSAAEPSTGVGIVGMRERAHALGGDLVVADRAGRGGTELRCRLPYWVKPAPNEAVERVET